MQSRLSKRFKKLCDRYGYQIVPVMTRVNGHLTQRSDILRVEKYHEFVTTIPTEMRHFPMQGHTDLAGNTHPGFFECEQKIYNDRFYANWQ